MSREKRFTPGPLTVGFSDGSGMKTIRQCGDDIYKTKSVAAVRWGCSCCEDTSELTEEEVANAHLIAAAPELLEALEKALPYLKHNPAMYSNASEIIAKAYGEEND